MTKQKTSLLVLVLFTVITTVEGAPKKYGNKENFQV